MSDERLKKEELTVDLVGQREARESRRTTDRRDADRAVSERRDLSDDDRLTMFRQQLFNDALPDLPPIEGYHVCWLTTTNSRDPIQRRQMLGYEPVRPDEVGGIDYATLKTGEWAGHVGVNEMVAFKLPLHLYDAYMQEAHHNAPLSEEEKVKDAIENMRQQAEQAGAALIEDEGHRDLRDTAHPARGIFR